MSGVKRVAVALFPLGKTAHSAIFTQFVKPVLSAGQQLMCVGLMSHVPDKFVRREIEREVERHRKLYNTEIGGKMPARPADLLDQKLTDLIRKFPQLFAV